MSPLTNYTSCWTHKQIWIRRVYHFCRTNFTHLKLLKTGLVLFIPWVLLQEDGRNSLGRTRVGQESVVGILEESMKQSTRTCSIDLCSCLTKDRGKYSGKWYFQLFPNQIQIHWRSRVLCLDGNCFWALLFIIKAMWILSLKWAYLEIGSIKLYF